MSALHLGEFVERDATCGCGRSCSTIARPTPTSAAAIGDDVEGEDLAVDVAVSSARTREVDVHRVEDQLDRHQHHDGVLAGDDAVDADAEQHRSEQEEVDRASIGRSVLPGQDDGADGGGEQDERERQNGTGTDRRMLVADGCDGRASGAVGRAACRRSNASMSTPGEQAEQQRAPTGTPSAQPLLLRSDSLPIWARVSMMPNRNSTITAPM